MKVCRIMTLKYLELCKSWHVRFLKFVAFRHLNLHMCLLVHLGSVASQIKSWFLPITVSLEGMALTANLS